MITWVEELFLKLISSAVTGKPSDGISLSAEDADGLYRLADRHDLCHLVYYALSEAKIEIESFQAGSLMEQKYLKAIRRGARTDYAFSMAKELLAKAGIPYIPLKGVVINKLYPERWMRTSSDVDILVRKEDYKKAVDVFGGDARFEKGRECEHHYEFITEKKVRIELHRALMDEHDYKAADVVDDIWKSAACPVQGGMEYQMSDGWFYYHHILHMLMHFEGGGIGVRFFVDTWLLNRDASEETRKEREKYLEGGGLARFAKAVEQLSDIWMNANRPTSPALLTMEKLVLSGGIFGTTEQRVQYGSQKAGGRARYLLTRIFTPYNRLKLIYPVIGKHPALTPLFQVVRWFRILLRPSQSLAGDEIRTMIKGGKVSDDEIKEMRRDLGLL